MSVPESINQHASGMRQRCSATIATASSNHGHGNTGDPRTQLAEEGEPPRRLIVPTATTLELCRAIVTILSPYECKIRSSCNPAAEYFVGGVSKAPASTGSPCGRAGACQPQRQPSASAQA
jgi:hypothetical protein